MDVRDVTTNFTASNFLKSKPQRSQILFVELDKLVELDDLLILCLYFKGKVKFFFSYLQIRKDFISTNNTCLHLNVRKKE